MDTVITFFIKHTERIHAVFLKSTLPDAELLIPLPSTRASNGQEEGGGEGSLPGGGEGLGLGSEITGRIWGEQKESAWKSL